MSSSRRSVGTTRHVSNVSVRSRSTLSPGGSPKIARKGSTPVVHTGTSSNRALTGISRVASGAPVKQPRKSNDPSGGQIVRAEKDCSADLLKATNGRSTDKRASLNAVKAKVDAGNRRPERLKTNGTANARNTPRRLSSGTDTTYRKTSTSKERSAEKDGHTFVKRATRDINRNSAREKPIRSDSSDLETASKLVSAKVYELRTQLVNNSLIMGPIKDFVGQGGIESFVVLPLGRFSQNSKSLWRTAMMELLLEIAVPKRRIFLDPSLIDLEKESLRSHAFLHRGDPELPDDIEMLKDSVRAPGPTLVFAPSPDLTAVEAILRAYEERNRLSQLLIIGYSLHKLTELTKQVKSSESASTETLSSTNPIKIDAAANDSILTRLIDCVEEEAFPFDLFPQSAFAPVFAELRGHRLSDYPFSSRVAKNASCYGQEIRAASCDTLLTERSGSDKDVIATSEASTVLKAASSAPNLAHSSASRMPTALLTVGAICCGAGLAWMFISKR
ncbi:hypothetical protein BIW11_06695 [Tropilaelaps mercedesae]|uniref:SRR1-like domain-containing protein n=1 Tax=Tropilaelaps mercedesae TaxID=418985 RepID=A0A1V9XX08_9ACAR|nr:hypothetical protein BIW11_06695 [Tropilaelaps mercedesae]